MKTVKVFSSSKNNCGDDLTEQIRKWKKEEQKTGSVNIIEMHTTSVRRQMVISLLYEKQI
jgi:hypothetical protein